MNYKYKTIFSSKISPVISAEKDKYLCQASLKELKAFLPDIDIEKSWDLVPIAFQAFNFNKFNRNDDGIDAKTAVNIYKSFINRPINLEHSRHKCIGVTLSSYLTEYGSNQVLSEETVLNQVSPGNVSMGGVIWRVVDKELAAKIEESNDINSPFYGKVFTSFEVGFSDYDIVKIDGDSRNLEDGVIISDAEEKEKCEKILAASGGTGKIGNSYYYRLIKGDATGLGMAIVASPAAFLEPIVVKTDDDELEEDDKKEDKESESSLELIELESKNSVKESELTKNSVKDIIKTMKTIKTLAEVTDENLKEIAASNVHQIFEEVISQKSAEWVKERTEKENSIKAANDKIEAQKVEFEKLQSELKETIEKLNKLTELEASREKQAKFDVRLASILEVYELAKDEQEIVAGDIRDLNDEAFAAYEKKLAVLMKEKSKTAIAARKESEEKAKLETKEITKEIAASTNDATKTLDAAIENGEKDKTTVANAGDQKTLTFKEKYSKAFELNSENYVFPTKNKK